MYKFPADFSPTFMSSYKSIIDYESTDTLTENGAVSYNTTNSPLLDFFFKIVRDTTPESTVDMLKLSMEVDPLRATKAVFHLRDCRGGKGEKARFYDCIKWLVDSQYIDAVNDNLELIPKYGTFKDMFALCGTKLELAMLRVYAEQLKNDIDALNDVNVSDVLGYPINISLAAKWAPTEGGAFDKKHKLAKKLCGLLRSAHSPKFVKITNLKDYRQKLIAPLRAHLKIVERDMCSDNWENIKFENVPSIASKLYRKTFSKHQAERYSTYLMDVASGKTKINSSMIFPHQLVEHYINGGEYDETIELQWKSIVEKTRAKFGNKSAIAVVDVSGSMTGTPLNVAIALGLLLSECTTDSFASKLITFSSTPELVSIPDGTLQSKVKATMGINWQMSTNLQKTFELLLNFAKIFDVPNDKMPSTVYVFSDMQFDIAVGGSTNFDTIDKLYSNSIYSRPNLVFWNLRGNTVDFPAVSSSSKTALVSGFSQSMMDIFTNGDIIDPYTVMCNVLDSDRYSEIDYI